MPGMNATKTGLFQIQVTMAAWRAKKCGFRTCLRAAPENGQAQSGPPAFQDTAYRRVIEPADKGRCRQGEAQVGAEQSEIGQSPHRMRAPGHDDLQQGLCNRYSG
jgi:methylphosphotriester-DNA--protein-cysteine methyltransferase